jgi:hypothetical protein
MFRLLQNVEMLEDEERPELSGSTIAFINCKLNLNLSSSLQLMRATVLAESSDIS